MSVIKPFRALRPRPEVAKQVSSVPYDVCTRDELHTLVENNPISFLRVTRAELEFPDEIESESQEVLDFAKENLQRLIDEKVLNLEAEPSLYIYRLSSDTHSQTGVVACCSLDEYESGLIKKHEKTRPDKVEDRTRHMLTLRAQTGLIFLAFRQTENISELVSKAVVNEPIYDFLCALNFRHQIWKPAQNENFVEAFKKVPALYVADGHHRAEAASKAREILRNENPNHTGEEDYNFVVAGIFPDTDLNILPYNRIVKNLNHLSEDEFLQKLRAKFVVEETENPTPEKRGEICMYLPHRWYKLRLAEDISKDVDPIHALDVSVLQDFILKPILGIEDVRTDEQIGFVGGARGTRELEKLVDSGNVQVAFSMFPTSIEDLFTVSDAGEIMPPKSTWFEPKLRDGLLVHLI